MWIFPFLLSFISNRWNYTFLPKDDPTVTNFFSIYFENSSKLFIFTIWIKNTNKKLFLSLPFTFAMKFLLIYSIKSCLYFNFSLFFNENFPLLFGENLNIWISPFLRVSNQILEIILFCPGMRILKIFSICCENKPKLFIFTIYNSKHNSTTFLEFLLYFCNEISLIYSIKNFLYFNFFFTFWWKSKHMNISVSIEFQIKSLKFHFFALWSGP